MTKPVEPAMTGPEWEGLLKLLLDAPTGGMLEDETPELVHHVWHRGGVERIAAYLLAHGVSLSGSRSEAGARLTAQSVRAAHEAAGLWNFATDEQYEAIARFLDVPRSEGSGEGLREAAQQQRQRIAELEAENERLRGGPILDVAVGVMPVERNVKLSGSAHGTTGAAKLKGEG